MQVRSKDPTHALCQPTLNTITKLFSLPSLWMVKHNIESPPILRIEFFRGVETSGCYVAELDEKVVGVVAYKKKV